MTSAAPELGRHPACAQSHITAPSAGEPIPTPRGQPLCPEWECGASEEGRKQRALSWCSEQDLPPGLWGHGSVGLTAGGVLAFSVTLGSF